MRTPRTPAACQLVQFGIRGIWRRHRDAAQARGVLAQGVGHHAVVGAAGAGRDEHAAREAELIEMGDKGAGGMLGRRVAAIHRERIACERAEHVGVAVAGAGGRRNTGAVRVWSGGRQGRVMVDGVRWMRSALFRGLQAAGGGQRLRAGVLALQRGQQFLRRRSLRHAAHGQQPALRRCPPPAPCAARCSASPPPPPVCRPGPAGPSPWSPRSWPARIRAAWVPSAARRRARATSPPAHAARRTGYAAPSSVSWSTTMSICPPMRSIRAGAEPL